MKKILISMACLLVFAQLAIAQSVIRGRVVENDGDAIVGASVRVKGTSRGTITDNTGGFGITAKSTDELQITAIGFKPTTISPENGMVVKLAKDNKAINEVVVTAFGQKRQSREVGYASQNVGGAEINQAKTINPLNGLTGKVSGLNIQTSSNSINPKVRVTLRGNRHITGQNQALIVVDGILVDNDFFTKLNPNDIESINILKGAAASAIYGSEASNGVMIVTTKRGGAGKGRSKISFTSTVQAERVAYLPNLQNRFGSYGGETPGQYLGITFPNDPSKTYYPYENQSYGPEYNGQPVPIGGPVSVTFADGQQADLTRLIAYSPVENSKLGFFQTGLSLQNGVSIASGDETSNLFVGYQNVRVSGVVPKDRADRNIFRINGGKAFGKFRVDFNTNYTNEKLNQVGGSYNQDRPVYWSIINGPQHVNYDDYIDWKTNPFASPDGYFNAYYGNPWWQIDESRLRSNNNFIQGNVKATIDILPWLSASYNVGMNNSTYDGSFNKNGYTFAPWAIADPWQAGASPSSIKYLAPSFGVENDRRNRINGDLLLTARKSFGDFTTKLLLGQTAWKRTRTVDRIGSQTLVFNNLFNIGSRQGEPGASNFQTVNTLVGLFGDATIGYKNYAFLHTSVRNETDSRLVGSKRNYTYYGVDGSLVLTDLIPNMREKASYLNYAKLRAGIASVGQVNIDPYNLYNTINPGAGFPYGSNVGFSLSNVFKNPEIVPENTTEREVGVELTFLNRINFSANYYNAKTTNQTITADVSAASGAQSSVINLGSMTNKGVELDLRLTPFLKLGPVKWNVGANYSYNKNRVGADLGNQVALTPTTNIFGLGTTTTVTPVYAIPGYAYPYVKESDWKRSPDGKIIVDANTGLPSRSDTLAWFGTSTPSKILGLTSSFSWKGFTLSGVADARFGAVINNLIGEDLDFTGISAYSAQTGRQPFVIPNTVIQNADGTFTENTGAVVNDANWAFWANTWNRTHSQYVNSADFWKLRELALTYALPASFLPRLKYVQGASITLSGRNLFMWRSKDNVWTDPEFSEDETGNAVGATSIRQTPPTRIYGASININF
jgi:TonB-linked SusC/RagA family outer membrane protein